MLSGNLSGDEKVEIDFSLSIVSHGQGSLARKLLLDIVKLNLQKTEIILTLNIPEFEEFIEAGRDLRLIILRNASPKGYGENNNRAFRCSSGKFFCVLNPDLRLYPLNFKLLMKSLMRPSVGVVAPMVLCPDGSIQDSARKKPKITTMLNRFFRSNNSEYEAGDEAIEVDWVSGCFMMFKRETFKTVNGFDERFFMYLEDADICIRLKELGFSTLFQPKTHVIHDARRSSRKKPLFFLMHVTSTYKYFAKRLLRRVLREIQ